MVRAGWLIAATLAVGMAGWLVHARYGAGAAVAAVPQRPSIATDAPPATVAIATDAGTAAVAPEPAPLTSQQVDELLVEAQGADGGTRAKALDELAAAPEAQALPVLQKVLNGGEPIDRQLALNSLHVLALRQGDSAGWIREALRQVIYDGGDEAVSSGAQAVLDDIEYQTPPASVDAAH